jgi:DNA-binding MarR family transcriptional regulator
MNTAEAVAGPVTGSPDRSAALRLTNSVGRMVRMLRRSYIGPLGASATSALATVVREGPIRLGDLADREGVTPATLSRVVTVLEREGYVDRRTDPTDRRSAFLAATPSGTDTLEQVATARAALLAERIATLSEPERAALAAGLDVIERLVADPPHRR